MPTELRHLEDLDGDGNYCDCDDDKTVIGHGLPDLTAGLINTFRLEGLI